MSALKAIVIAAGFAALLLSSLAIFNYSVDPQCFYRCESIEANRPVTNNYYQVLQRVLAHPEAEQILLGSSRAVTTSPMELQRKFALKTISLGAFGADMFAKIAMLNFAEKNLELRRVIWYADYFEMIPERTEDKLLGSPALMTELGEGAKFLNSKRAFNSVASLIDQNTFNASIQALTKVDVRKIAASLGGSEGEIENCEKSDFRGSETEHSLGKKIDQYYENYTSQILGSPQDEVFWRFFTEKLLDLSRKNIEVIIYVLPYHPAFTNRLAIEYPEIYRHHQVWVERLQGLKIKGVTVRNFFDGLPGDDGSPMFWTDGVHFTCRGVKAMLSKQW